MTLKSKKYGFLVGVLLGVAGIFTAQASSSIVTFSVNMNTNLLNGTFLQTDTVYVNGTFDGWSGGIALVEVGNTGIYTNTVNDTDDANGSALYYKFSDNDVNQGNGGFESLPDGNNRVAMLPATSGGSLVLPTPFFSDDGAGVIQNVSFSVDMSEQIVLGVFTNGTSTVQVSGNFNGWPGGASVDHLTNDPNIIITNTVGDITVYTTNVYDGTFTATNSPNSLQPFKYLENGNYESTITPTTNSDNGSTGGNRWFVLNPSSPVTVPLADYDGEVYAPLSQVTFSVDMSAQLYYGNWVSTEPVFCGGVNGDWNFTPSTTMTNNPSASNTNIYYITFTCPQGSIESYKFVYTNSLDGGETNYEDPASTDGNNRSYTVPAASIVSVPTVFFSDLSIVDLLTTNVLVTFTVNMTNASQYPSGPAFNPSSDTVYVNGNWIDWNNEEWNPIDLAPYELTNNPVGSEVYSGQFLVPFGGPLNIIYQYSIDGTADEAAANDNHERYIRSTATGAYNFPMDTFGNQYNEPAFGQLAVGPASSGTVPLSWLGAPNVTVQTTTNLANSVWVTHPETSGTNWTAGTYGTNGLVSATNWPAGSSKTLFYRLLKQ